MDSLEIPQFVDFDVNKEACKQELSVSCSNSKSELSSNFNFEKKSYGFFASINTDAVQMSTKLSDNKIKIDFSPNIPNGSLGISATQDGGLKLEYKLIQKLRVANVYCDVIGSYKENDASISFKGKTNFANTDFMLAFPANPKLTISTRSSSFKFNAEISKKSFYTLAFRYGFFDFGVSCKDEVNLGAAYITPFWNFAANYNVNKNKLAGAFQISRNSSALKMNTEVDINDLSTNWGFGVNYYITPFTLLYAKMSEDLSPLFGMKRKILGTDLTIKTQIVKSKPVFGASLKIKC